MQVAGKKVAVVGMDGAFPTCGNLNDFDRKIFTDQSLVREWGLALQYGKQLRSTVSGFITEAEMGLEAVWGPVTENYPETYIDKLGRIPDGNLSTADMGSIWAMLGAQEACEMAGWTKQEIESELTGVVVGSGGAGNQILRIAWHYFFQMGKKARIAGAHTVDRSMSYREAANISCLLKTKGACESITSACATGLGNIGYAYRLIKFGIQDRAIAGGVEGTALETFIGFDGMMILSKGFQASEESSSARLISTGTALCALLVQVLSRWRNTGWQRHAALKYWALLTNISIILTETAICFILRLPASKGYGKDYCRIKA